MSQGIIVLLACIATLAMFAAAQTEIGRLLAALLITGGNGS